MKLTPLADRVILKICLLYTSPLVLFRAVHSFFVVFVGRERRAARLSSAAAVPAAAGGRPRKGRVAGRTALRAHAERGGRRAAPRIDAAGAFL